MFVRVHDDGIAASLRHADGHDFFGEHTGFDSRFRPLLAAQGERILVLAGNTEIVGDILRGLRHRIDAVLLLQFTVHETPAERGVVDFRVTPEGRGLFRHDERRARHRLHAAGNRQLDTAGSDRVRSIADRVHPRAAQAIDGCRRNGGRQAGEQCRHACDIAIVFTGLVGTTVDDVVDSGGVELHLTFE